MAKKSRNDSNFSEEKEVVEQVIEGQLEVTPEGKITETADEPKAKVEVIEAGDYVKVKPDVSNDMLGRRIHNGIKNYNYLVKLVRDDGYLVIECLTYNFILHMNEVTKV